jgi:predicted heme/steroid binding protein
MRKISEAELSQADGVRSSLIWIAYNGKVYDVKSSPLFRGGKHFRHPAGTDLSDQMIKAPHLKAVLDKFEVIGILE